VCEFFEAEPSQLSQPATKRQLLAAALCELRDAQWALAVGCSASPSLMTPLSLDAVLGGALGRGGVRRLPAARRALAAASKRAMLLPGDA
jgi:hypothetical protein